MSASASIVWTGARNSSQLLKLLYHMQMTKEIQIAKREEITFLLLRAIVQVFPLPTLHQQIAKIEGAIFQAQVEFLTTVLNGITDQLALQEATPDAQWLYYWGTMLQTILSSSIETQQQLMQELVQLHTRTHAERIANSTDEFVLLTKSIPFLASAQFAPPRIYSKFTTESVLTVLKGIDPKIESVLSTYETQLNGWEPCTIRISPVFSIFAQRDGSSWYFKLISTKTENESPIILDAVKKENVFRAKQLLLGYIRSNSQQENPFIWHPEIFANKDERLPLNRYLKNAITAESGDDIRVIRTIIAGLLQRQPEAIQTFLRFRKLNHQTDTPLTDSTIFYDEKNDLYWQARRTYTVEGATFVIVCWDGKNNSLELTPNRLQFDSLTNEPTV